ncbi:MAG: NTP transferase domain-containing protein [Deltaproteobacteria bacterium]|nr:NTP transferase domain-containing protein [Deltaproteobacteria bacterium]
MEATEAGGERRRPDGRFGDVSAALLLGGASRRMGRDKALLEYAGVALATRTARLLAEHFEDVLLVGGEPPPDAPGRRVRDPEGPRSALRGLVGALAAARGSRVLVVATDLPLLGPELLLALVAWPEAGVVLPRRDDGLEPLCAVWAREVALREAQARLAAGRLALHELAAALPHEVLEGADLRVVDPTGAQLANANTPEDWARIERLGRG